MGQWANEFAMIIGTHTVEERINHLKSFSLTTLKPWRAHDPCARTLESQT